MGIIVSVPLSSVSRPSSNIRITRSIAPTPATSLPCTAAVTSSFGPGFRPANWWTRRWVGGAVRASLMG